MYVFACILDHAEYEGTKRKQSARVDDVFSSNSHEFMEGNNLNSLDLLEYLPTLQVPL